jgi:type VI protein secretion system component VasK
MSGWLRHFALNARARTGFSTAVVIWAVIAAVAAVAAVIFLLVAAFIWLADRYDALVAGVILGCVFVVVTLIAIIACLLTRRRNVERARLELAARESNASWLDPKLMAVGVQVGQAVGWRRLAMLVAATLLAAGVAKEWSGRKQSDDGAPPPEEQ